MVGYYWDKFYDQINALQITRFAEEIKDYTSIYANQSTQHLRFFSTDRAEISNKAGMAQ